jgi:signal transduction histidine kinase
MLAANRTNVKPFPVHLLKTKKSYEDTLGKRKISALIVDDSPADLRLLCFHLENMESLSVEVTPVQSLSEARQAVAMVHYDIAFLDLGLPESDGPETVSKFISHAPNIPVVVVTGYDDEATGIESISRGAQDYIAKQNLNVAGISASMRHAIERQKLYNQMERLLVDNPNPLVIVDCDNVIQFANPAAVEWYQEGSNKLVDTIFPANIYTCDKTEIVLEKSDSTQHTVELHIKPTLWAGSRSFLVSLIDVSARKRSEEELHAEKELALEDVETKNEFLSNVGHELKTPLNAIIGFSELLLEQAQGSIKNEAYLEYIEVIRDSGIALNTQISDLLELSKLNTDSAELIFDDMNLSEVVAQLVHDMKPTANAKRISLNYTPTSEDIHYHGDVRKMRIVLRHIVSNALQFTPTNGSVMVSLAERDSHIICLVTDTGCGINESEISRVLEPFERGTNSPMTASHEGAGVGLTLANKLLALHYGTLELVSKPDAGTSAIIKLPIDHI